jgi:hypothetical protein
MQDVEEVQER